MNGFIRVTVRDFNNKENKSKKALIKVSEIVAVESPDSLENTRPDYYGEGGFTRIFVKEQYPIRVLETLDEVELLMVSSLNS
jgi:hypothetical protein